MEALTGYLERTKKKKKQKRKSKAPLSERGHSRGLQFGLTTR